MESFSIRRMFSFSRLQMKELFISSKPMDNIKKLIVCSFSICIVCTLIHQDSLSESLSQIEQLIILISYYFTFWKLLSDMLSNNGLINKFNIPTTVTERYVSLYVSTLFIGTAIMIPLVIISNIIMQALIPLFFAEEAKGLHLIFGGRENSLRRIITAICIVAYLDILTPFGVLWKKFNKILVIGITSAIVISYILPVVFMFIYGISKFTVLYIWIAISIFTSMLLIILTLKKLKTMEAE